MRWAPLLLVVACGAKTPVSENIAPALQYGEAELAVLQSPDLDGDGRGERVAASNLGDEVWILRLPR